MSKIDQQLGHTTVISLLWYQLLCDEVDYLVETCNNQNPLQMCVRFRDAIERAKARQVEGCSVVAQCVGIIAYTGDTASTHREQPISIREQTLCVSG